MRSIARSRDHAHIIANAGKLGNTTELNITIKQAVQLQQLQRSNQICSKYRWNSEHAQLTKINHGLCGPERVWN